MVVGRRDSAVLLIPLGRTPAVATSFVKYVYEGLDLYPEVVILIHTRDEVVEGGARAVEYYIGELDRKIKIYRVVVDVDDVRSFQDAKSFMDSLLSTLSEIYSQYGDRQFLVCISGGRKSMVSLTTMAAALIRPPRVFHITHRVREATYLRPIDEVYKELAEADELNLQLLMDNYRDEIYSDLDIDLGDMMVVELPLIPIPRSYIKFIYDVLMGQARYSDYIDSDVLRDFIDADLVRVVGDEILPKEKLLLFEGFKI